MVTSLEGRGIAFLWIASMADLSGALPRDWGIPFPLGLNSHQVWLLLRMGPRWTFLLPMLRLSVPVLGVCRVWVFDGCAMGEVPGRFVLHRSLCLVSLSLSGLNVFAGCKYVGLCPLHCST